MKKLLKRIAMFLKKHFGRQMTVEEILEREG